MEPKTEQKTETETKETETKVTEPKMKIKWLDAAVGTVVIVVLAVAGTLLVLAASGKK